MWLLEVVPATKGAAAFDLCQRDEERLRADLLYVVQSLAAYAQVERCCQLQHICSLTAEGPATRWTPCQFVQLLWFEQKVHHWLPGIALQPFTC